MREEPPQELIALVERLGLATAGQVGMMGRRVRRLARGLPPFESVWVDALAQARILTPFQGGEINAGRGDALRIGPFVLCRRLPSPGYADCYVARETGSEEVARLAVVQPVGGQAPDLVSRLEALLARCESLDSQVLAPITRVGVDGDRIWAASRHVRGRTAAEWMVRSGRFPPHLVLEIARQMVAALVLLEEAGLCHGDIGASGLILTEQGDLALPQPGLRAVIHPEEGHGQADLDPEAYDCLAPERIAEGAPPSASTDVYACGCLWWHLLAGRPPFPGGSGQAKLQAIESVRVPEVSHLAPETPGPLAAAISASMQRDPSLRSESMGRLGSMLGPPTRAGKRALRRYLGWPLRAATHWATFSFTTQGSRRAPSWLAATAGCLAAAAAITWSIWISGLLGPIREPAPVSPLAGGWSIREPAPLAPLAGRGAGGEGFSEQKPMADTVHLAGAQTIPRDTGEDTFDDRPDDLVLPEGSPVAIESLEFQPGQCVRGEPGCRPSVAVPYGGLVVRPEDLRFEDVDFIWNDAAAPAPSTETQPAIIHVEAARAEFRGCLFRAAKTATRAPVAVRWTHPADRGGAELSLFSGQLRLSDCVLQHVGVGVACETLGAPAVEVANVLYLGTGPLVQLDHCPNADEPVLIALSNVTLRDAGPLLECRYQEIPDQPGNVSIEANNCALATRPDAALLCFVGPGRPDRMLSKIRWTGQGSLVLPDAVIAAWRQPDGEPQVLDDALVSIAGLVRSRVSFAGPAEAGPNASRILHWQVPLRSPDPPGIDPQTLAWPGP